MTLLRRRLPRRALGALITAALCAVGGGCGYTPVHAGLREPMHVTLASSKVADAVATDEVLAGAREELARFGVLAPGDGYPRCEIEVLRADEASEGIAALGDDTSSGSLAPRARATRVGVVARAWVVYTPGGQRERDTGDIRTFTTADVAGDARAATFRHAGALRAAGRVVGRRLAARILGLPAASDDGS